MIPKTILLLVLSSLTHTARAECPSERFILKTLTRVSENARDNIQQYHALTQNFLTRIQSDEMNAQPSNQSQYLHAWLQTAQTEIHSQEYALLKFVGCDYANQWMKQLKDIGETEKARGLTAAVQQSVTAATRLHQLLSKGASQ